MKPLDLAGLGNTGNRFIADLENGTPTVQLQKVLDVGTTWTCWAWRWWCAPRPLGRPPRCRGRVMQPRPERLDVYYGSELVGAVHDGAPLGFEYAPGWLTPAEGRQRMSLAAIPLRPGRQATPEVRAFFENLLPEGELRDYLSAQRKASTLFALLLEVAGDTAGAFVLVAPGQTPEPPRYEATTWEAIAAILAKRSASAIEARASPPTDRPKLQSNEAARFAVTDGAAHRRAAEHGPRAPASDRA